jgi:hypothetical protein
LWEATESEDALVKKRAKGWYRDPERPRHHRYWDGERWEVGQDTGQEPEQGPATTGGIAPEEQAPG